MAEAASGPETAQPKAAAKARARAAKAAAKAAAKKAAEAERREEKRRKKAAKKERKAKEEAGLSTVQFRLKLFSWQAKAAKEKERRKRANTARRNKRQALREDPDRAWELLGQRAADAHRKAEARFAKSPQLGEFPGDDSQPAYSCLRLRPNAG